MFRLNPFGRVLAVLAVLAVTLVVIPASLVGAAGDCEAVDGTSPQTVSVPQWNSSSGWIELATEDTVLAQLTGVQVSVEANGTDGNQVGLVADWMPQPMVDLDEGSVFLPVSAVEVVSLVVDHTPGAEYEVSVVLCAAEGEGVNGGGSDCSGAVTTVTVPQWNSSSGWVNLSTDAALLADVVGVQLQVLANGPNGTLGNRVGLVADWVPHETVELDEGSVFLPVSAVTALSVEVVHQVGAEYTISATLCGGVSATPTPVPVEPTATPVEPTATATPIPVEPTATPTPIAVEPTATPTPVSPVEPTATPTPTATPVEPRGDGSLPQRAGNGSLVTGQDSGRTLAHGFGNWSSKPGVVNTLTTDCIELHDAYWTEGPDGLAYHTWHPASEIHPITNEGCVYGHEHGDNPTDAPPEVFAYGGGWPAFGYAVEQSGGPRHEDHFGHKVTVARYEASIGNPPNSNQPVYEAGFTCDWYSKIHQGGYSADAITNQVHEYFLTVRCTDDPTGNGAFRTLFSVKTAIPFGGPNEFRNMCFAENQPFDPDDPGQELEVGTWNVIDASTVRDFDGSSIVMQSMNPDVRAETGFNHREVSCVEPSQSLYQDGTVDYLNQFDFWTQPWTVRGPGGVNVQFQPYYGIKDAARTYDNSPSADGAPRDDAAVAYTVDICNGLVADDLRFCADSYGADPFGTESPFKGALRSINFKSINIYDNSTGRATDVFCTDSFGQVASESVGDTCPAGTVLQKITNGFNGKTDWWNWTNPDTGVTGAIAGSIRVDGQRVKYPKRSIAGIDSVADFFVYDLRRPNADGTGCPYGAVAAPAWPQHAYCPVGIGFEQLGDHRDDVLPTVANAVIPGFNTGLHAPN